MKQIMRATMIIGLLIGLLKPLSAGAPEAPLPPSGSVQEGGPPAGPSMSSGALLGLLGTLAKPAAAPTSPPQGPYPMFQFLGPNLWGDAPVNPEMMGYVLRLQGELMMKMGEVLVKYGEMIGEKKP
jgi:hypothetical protein